MTRSFGLYRKGLIGAWRSGFPILGSSLEDLTRRLLVNAKRTTYDNSIHLFLLMLKYFVSLFQLITFFNNPSEIILDLHDFGSMITLHLLDLIFRLLELGLEMVDLPLQLILRKIIWNKLMKRLVNTRKS